MKTRLILGVYVFLVGFSIHTMMESSAPTTLNDFFLPGSQPNQSGNLENPSKCDNCHGGYDENLEPAFFWRGSMMSQAARDPLFYAAMTIANQDAPESGDLCLRCHTPKGWLEGRSVPTDGSSLTNADREGVTCDFCHKLIKPTSLGVNPFADDAQYTSETFSLDQSYLANISPVPEYSANGMYIADNSNAKRGPYIDADATHQFIYSPFHSTPEVCGTCHDVSNPVFSAINDGEGNAIDYEPNDFDTPAPEFDPYAMFPVERTFSEWKMSDYNSATGIQSDAFGGNLTHVSSCQDCHMRDTTGIGCNKNPPIRSDLPLHDMTGGNTFIPRTLNTLFPGDVDVEALDEGVERARYMLRNAATMSMTVDAGSREVVVNVTNETGHKLPSGYPEGRRIWINLKAWGQAGEIYESCYYDTTTAVLSHDADAKIYEIKPGLSPDLALSLGLTAGPSFHFVLNDTVYKDNRIPPRGFTNANFKAIQSQPVGYSYVDGQYWDETTYFIPFDPIAVKATLYYQTASKEYIEFLRDENVTDQWGTTLYNLWLAHGKSSPEIMNSTSWGVPIIDEDEDGFIAAADCNDLDETVYPGAMELMDCQDNDCDGWTDEDHTSVTDHVWTGCGSTDTWNQDNNWNANSVPAINQDVYIPGAMLGDHYPVITTGINIQTLTVEAGATLTIGSAGSLHIINIDAGNDPALDIYGVLEINGSLTVDNNVTKGIIIHTGGTLIINGSASLDSYRLRGIENYGILQVTSTGTMSINNISGDAYYNGPNSNLQVEGILNLMK